MTPENKAPLTAEQRAATFLDRDFVTMQGWHLRDQIVAEIREAEASVEKQCEARIREAMQAEYERGRSGWLINREDYLNERERQEALISKKWRKEWFHRGFESGYDSGYNHGYKEGFYAGRDMTEGNEAAGK